MVARKKKSTRQGVKRPTLKQQREEVERAKQELFALMQNASPLLSRTRLGHGLGMQFDGDRDLYATFGYPVRLEYRDYRNMYDRMGMATRLVEKFADDTWGKPPVLVDGDARSDGVGDKTTEFLDNWNELVKKLQVWQILRQADVMCGIGRYSIVFLGTTGAFNAPIRKEGGLYYISAFDEHQAKIKSYIRNRNTELYGMPEKYEVKFSTLEEWENTQDQLVHHSRCIHVSENRLGSRVFGRPRMQEVFNRLMDLEKVTGGGAEAAWLAVYMGFLILTREGAELPKETSTEWNEIETALENFAHRIQRYATLSGVEKIENLGVHEVRIKDIWTVLMGDLAGSKGIPQRILLGSERGELASSQDMQEWNGVVRNRQKNFAEPEMVDPLINKGIELGVLTPPKSGKWTTEWQPVYTPTQVEEAEFALRVAQAANQATNGLPELVVRPNEIRGMVHLPPIDPEEIIEEQLAMEELKNAGTEDEENLAGEEVASDQPAKPERSNGQKAQVRAVPPRANGNR